ncbi:hypothetical protein LPB19_13490 [Marinobacter salinisoli]|uniref:CNP1-like uncharacterized domain-containing protein n=1 Tax=Marinobacter salinisoli TaxID=2769486 RepID=A0ABX7MPL3_9GAMM|nr:hypothetical protein [Marinobacter salinisoli]QSP94194.1 hypothetical protein LPB19_13490 [Marinobacter salinisoli]
MKKILLRRILIFLSVSGLGFAFVPFLSSLAPPEAAKEEIKKIELNISELKAGEVYSFTVQGRPVLVLKPSLEQEKSIELLNDHVWDRDHRSFGGAYVFVGLSTSRKGPCLLEHKPAQESWLKSHDKDSKWYGGYWDHSCEISYDYAGRAIKDYPYTFNGLDDRAENLSSPAVKFISDTVLEIE